MKQRAFTLIELLVVIAVIAVLMGILIPALSRARDQAKRAHCGGSIRQLTYAAVMYSEDNRGTFPPGQAVYGRSWGIYPVWIRQNTENQGFIAQGILFEAGIVKDPKLYYCPGNRNPNLKYGKYLAPNPGGGWPQTGRVPEDVPATQNWIWTTFHYRSLWTGSEWRAVSSHKDNGGTAIFADVFTDPSRGVELHHKSGYNAGYADGHVRFVKDPERVIEGLNGGSSYHTNYDFQDYAWKEFFDEGGRRYPLPDNVTSMITID
ncbi:MAG TPA: type II secretion system protein [candidate division Zixibacteria bacterium]|nr:type II secretion system protein [candidate division Zixibacteria bacterium]